MVVNWNKAKLKFFIDYKTVDEWREFIWEFQQSIYIVSKKIYIMRIIDWFACFSNQMLLSDDPNFHVDMNIPYASIWVFDWTFVG